MYHGRYVQVRNGIYKAQTASPLPKAQADLEGSGKTTLLSIILGHHPRSFSLPATALTLFNKPRRLTPTPTLRAMIGHTSPEIYASFPRGMGLSALAAVGSGFEGVFSRRQLSTEQKERVLSMLEFFQDQLSTGRSGSNGSTKRDLALRLFAHYTPPQQALLLFLRAMVARCPLVILDEPAQGMDEAIWQRCCEFLEKEWKENPDQAVVVVSHYEDEVSGSW
jgi:ABC-type molybdenum transport system ATPase subunit/photorepair protein PhrA